MTGTVLGYPSGWTLAVLDSADEAAAAARALADAGLFADDIALLVSADDAETFKRLGASAGVAARLRRTMQFLTMDQMPDLHVYDLALAQGRALLAIRVDDPAARRSAIDTMRSHGAHCVNRFGSWATEEIAPWRGEMPELPDHLRR
jgi:hypothetical protein